jgi:D-alanine--poly(phosphoribitol) ligase subunit 1
MPDVQIKIVDKDLNPLLEGERGEILIAGLNVSTGYMHKPELTAKVFTTFNSLPAYRTGDWGRIKNNILFFEGRMDNQIKLHGHRIELGDIESNLQLMSEVTDAVVLPIIKNNKIDSLAAFIVLSVNKDCSDFEMASKLKLNLSLKLPSYMIPRKFIFLDKFPITANGKADRRELAQLIS